MTTLLNWPGFLRWLALTVVIGILSAIGFVALTDPYGLYHIFEHPGINVIKPPLSRHVNEIKQYQAARIKPDTLILGNSRAEIGLNPESPALVRRGKSAYNFAIRGTSIASSQGQVEYLQHIGLNPKTILLGIEFTDFMTASSSAAPGASQADSPAEPSFAVERWFWRLDSLFSMASIKDAIMTIFIQSNPEAASVTARGFNPLREYLPMARNEGYFSFFQQRAQENTKTFLKKSSGRLDVTDIIRLRAIIDNTAQPGGDIILFFYPYHAQILALFEETGLWNAFEEWKRLVVDEANAARKRHPDTQITLVDFTGYGAYQCETIPIKNDRKTSTRWYWEAGHFKQELGDLVLDKALSLSAKAPHDTGSGPVFGVWLDEASLLQNQQRIAKERDECLSANPQLFAAVKQLVSAARQH